MIKGWRPGLKGPITEKEKKKRGGELFNENITPGITHYYKLL